MDDLPHDAKPERGFWSRNWKWALPVGCLSLALPCTCVGGLIAYGTFSAVTGGGPYLQALSLAIGDPDVQAALGEEVKPRLRLDGSLSVSQTEGEVAFTIPLDGSEADGTLHVEARREGGGDWRYDRLEVEVPDGRPIDLLPRLGGPAARDEADRPALGAPDEGPPDGAPLELPPEEVPFEPGPRPGDEQI